MKKLIFIAISLSIIVTSQYGCGCLRTGISVSANGPSININPTISPKVNISPYSNQIMGQYAQLAFGYAFGVGGYWIWQSPLAEGEWTKWIITNGKNDKYNVEKAFLKKTENGKEWWRVSYQSVDQDTNTVIFEGLFTSDMGELRRLRGKIGNEEPREIPVTEGTYVYSKPVKLTKESLQGATIGIENVTVPAGTFSSKHVKYSSLTGGFVEWWINSKVPGGIVKYRVTDNDGKVQFTSVLKSFGNGATTILNSY